MKQAAVCERLACLLRPMKHSMSTQSVCGALCCGRGSVCHSVSHGCLVLCTVYRVIPQKLPATRTKPRSEHHPGMTSNNPLLLDAMHPLAGACSSACWHPITSEPPILQHNWQAVAMGTGLEWPDQVCNQPVNLLTMPDLAPFCWKVMQHRLTVQLSRPSHPACRTWKQHLRSWVHADVCMYAQLRR